MGLGTRKPLVSPQEETSIGPWVLTQAQSQLEQPFRRRNLTSQAIVLNNQHA